MMFTIFVAVTLFVVVPIDVVVKRNPKAESYALGLARVMTAARRPNWGSAVRYLEYARLFVANGQRWGIDPLIVACVAYVESSYRAKTPKLMRKVCKGTVTGCDRPGPCLPKHTMVCRRRWINNQEAGMMQVDNRYRFAREGYKACTGKRLTGGRVERMRRLWPPVVSICVGARALAVFKRLARRRKFRPKSHRNRRFFNVSWPGLLKHFWVAYYNWGPNKRRRNGYPRVVARCWRRYSIALRRLLRGNK